MNEPCNLVQATDNVKASNPEPEEKWTHVRRAKGVMFVAALLFPKDSPRPWAGQHLRTTPQPMGEVPIKSVLWQLTNLKLDIAPCPSWVINFFGSNSLILSWRGEHVLWSLALGRKKVLLQDWDLFLQWPKQGGNKLDSITLFTGHGVQGLNSLTCCHMGFAYKGRSSYTELYSWFREQKWVLRSSWCMLLHYLTPSAN